MLYLQSRNTNVSNIRQEIREEQNCLKVMSHNYCTIKINSVYYNVNQNRWHNWTLGSFMIQKENPCCMPFIKYMDGWYQKSCNVFKCYSGAIIVNLYLGRTSYLWLYLLLFKIISSIDVSHTFVNHIIFQGVFSGLKQLNCSLAKLIKRFFGLAMSWQYKLILNWIKQRFWSYFINVIIFLL